MFLDNLTMPLIINYCTMVSNIFLYVFKNNTIKIKLPSFLSWSFKNSNGWKLQISWNYYFYKEQWSWPEKANEKKIMLMLICCWESFLVALLALNVIYLRHIVLLCIVHLCGLTSLIRFWKKWKSHITIVCVVSWNYHGVTALVKCFVNLNICSFDEMLRNFTFGFMSRVIVSNNLLISSIYNSPCRLYSNMWTWLDSIIHSNRANSILNINWFLPYLLQFIYLWCWYYLHNYFTDSIYTMYFIFLVIIYGLWICNKHLNNDLKMAQILLGILLWLNP